MASLVEKAAVLREQLGLPAGLPLNALVEQATIQFGLEEEVKGLPLIQKADACMSQLGRQGIPVVARVVAAVPMAPVQQEVRLEWQPSSHCRLEEGGRSITRQRGTDGQWVLMRVHAPITGPGTYTLHVRNEHDPSGDGCWMFGVAAASRQADLARDWGGADQYRGLQMIRADCGQVWRDGPKAEKLGTIGKVEGADIHAVLVVRADGGAELTLSCPSRGRGPVTSRFDWLAPHLRAGGVHWAMLTYRVHSQFTTTHRTDQPGGALDVPAPVPIQPVQPQQQVVRLRWSQFGARKYLMISDNDIEHGWRHRTFAGELDHHARAKPGSQKSLWAIEPVGDQVRLHSFCYPGKYLMASDCHIHGGWRHQGFAAPLDHRHHAVPGAQKSLWTVEPAGGGQTRLRWSCPQYGGDKFLMASDAEIKYGWWHGAFAAPLNHQHRSVPGEQKSLWTIEPVDEHEAAIVRGAVHSVQQDGAGGCCVVQ